MNRGSAFPGIARRFAVALGLLLLVVLALVQCRPVADRFVGVDLGAGGGLSAKSHCARRCNELWKQGSRAKWVRHRDAVRSCGSDAACRKSEARRHEQEMRLLVQARRACKRGCYNEGAGGVQ